MKSVAKLKEEARRHEQRSEWEAAIRAYESVLERMDEDEDPVDLMIYNRVGDLFLRTGQPDRAVEYFLMAAERYADEGLYNNAIALCNKALRNRAGNPDIYRRLGRYSDAQGFTADARQHFLAFADPRFQIGEVEEVLGALEEYPRLVHDAETREEVASLLRKVGATEEANRQRQRAYTLWLAAGEEERAKELGRAILADDPSIDLEALAPTEELIAAGQAAEDPAAALPGIELLSAADAAGIASEEDSAEMPAEGDAAAESIVDAPTIETPAPLEAEADDEVEPLPLLDPAQEFGAVEVDAASTPESSDSGELEESGGLEMGMIDLDSFGDDEFDTEDIGAAEPLPFLDEPVEDADASGPVGQPSSPAAEPRVSVAPEPAASPSPEPQASPAAEPAASSAPVPPASPASASSSSPPAASAPPEGGFIDLADLLAEGDAESGESATRTAGIGELLAPYRARSIDHGAEDPASRYDLGLAFKEMGLVEEAIAEFVAALDAGGESLKVYEELGGSLLQKGDTEVATQVLEHALTLPRPDESGAIGVYYLLGRCHETAGRAAEAREMYQRVAGLDATFQDVAERLSKL